MKTIISQGFLLLISLAIFGLFVITLDSKDQGAIMAAASVAVIVLSVVIERIYPFKSGWNEGDNDTLGDITLFVMIFGVLDSALKWLTPFGILILFGNWSGQGMDLPLWLQAILAGLLIEFGAYVSHYLHHNNRFLWPLHAMHHSPERLYTLNNFRFHPFNHVINHLLMIVPPLLIGFSAPAILAYTALSTPILLLQHSNIDFRFGWLNLILNTNEAHRWHHSDRLQEGNSNYGRATLIFDQIFKTYYFPNGQNTPEKIGLYQSSENFPRARNTVAQLLYPFSRQCCSGSN